MGSRSIIAFTIVTEHIMRSLITRGLAVALLLAPAGAVAQSFPTDNPVLRKIWDEGMDRSQTTALMQALTDSIGPRLTGSPALKAGSDWLIALYTKWGVAAHAEQYGTWLGWRRGPSHVDLIRPRVRSLEAMALSWSPPTPKGKPVEGDVVLLPDLPDSAAYAAWMPQVKGKFVAISFPQPTCRPDAAWEEYSAPAATDRMMMRFMGGRAAPTVFDEMRAERAAADSAWNARFSTPRQPGKTGYSTRTLPAALERAGAAGILTSEWPNGYGAVRIFQARTEKIPTFSLSCQDYGLVARLAEHHQGPVVRADAEAEFLGNVPTINTIAELKGAEKPNEYVVLSAHFDSWDGGSGATDNGTGTVIMMEAMRILKAVYPNPKRTILVGHWNSEEQGLNGSAAFAHDHPEVVQGLQALFNQDNGTGRIASISALGMEGASEFLGRWVGQLPSELSRGLRLDLPGQPSGGGSDHASFICAPAPAFSLGSDPWDYFSYTWHTNMDTYDMVVLDNVRRNAVLTAMLAYLASEDPQTIPRVERVMPVNPRTGQQGTWPTCRDGMRTGPAPNQ
jgi:carboxypeptidase Q